MKRIVFFGQEPYKSFKGGIGSYINHRAYLLSKNNFSIWWTNAFEYSEFDLQTCKWKEPIRLKKQNLFYRFLSKYFLKYNTFWENIEKNIKAEIVEFPDGFSLLIPKKRKARIIIQCHSSFIIRSFLNKSPIKIQHRIYNNLKILLQKNAFLQADSILACSNEVALLEGGFYKIHPDRFTIIPHYFSFDAESFEINNNDNESKFFLVIGNFEYLKGFDLVLHAFQQYIEKGGTFRLKFIGNEGWADKLFKGEWGNSKIISAFRKSNANSFVDFYGTLGKDEMSKIRKNASSVIISSRYESFTMVAGECFLSGTPLIISERTGWVRLVERFNAGIIVDPYNPKEMSEAMFLMEDHSVRTDYIRNGKNLAEYIQAKNLAEKTVGFYNSL